MVRWIDALLLSGYLICTPIPSNSLSKLSFELCENAINSDVSRPSLYPDPTEDSPEEEMSSLGTLLPMRATPFELAAATAAAARARAATGELLEEGETPLRGGLWLLLTLSLLLFLQRREIDYVIVEVET